MTPEPPPGQNPYGAAPPPPPGSHSSPYGAPQGASFSGGGQPPLAEWWERLVARIIDGIIFGVIGVILSTIFVVVLGSYLGAFLASLIAYGAYTAYDYTLHSKDGQTIGKKVMKIRLVAQSGGPLDSSLLLKRSLIMPGVLALSGIPYVGGLTGLFVLVVGILIIVDKAFRQGPHDKVASTLVVKAAP